MSLTLKSTLVVGLVIVFAFAFALTAFATDVTNATFDDEPTIDVKPNERFDVTVRIVVPNGEVVENIETDITPDGRAPVCHEGFELHEGTHFVDLDLKAPSNVDLDGYDLDIDTFGIFGPNTTVACDDDDHNGGDGFDEVIRVVGSGSGSNGGDDDGGETIFGLSFDDFLAAVIAAITGNTGGPAPANPQCEMLDDKMFGTQFGVTNQANGRLQGFLLSEGMSIPALENNTAPFGYWGPQTQGAINSYKSVHGCL